MKYFFTLLTMMVSGTAALNAQQLAAVEVTTPATEEGNATIKGKITSTDGNPAAFVTVSLKGTHKSTMTTEEGTFQFNNVKPGNYVLVVTLVGVETQEKNITIGDKEVVAMAISLKETSKQLETVIVEGRKTLNGRPVTIGKMDIAPMDLPQAITIIGQTVLKDQQAQRLSDVIKNVNGVYVGTTRGSTQETFFARGYSFGANNMFKNGARVNTGVMPEISGLERVEILKGGAAILYGNVAPGGILNMVTKKPKFNFGGEVSMRAGSYDLYKPSFDVYGPMSKNVAYRVNGTFEKANSFRDDVHSTRYYVNPSFLFKLSERTDLIVEGDYLYHDFTPDFGIGSLDNTKLAPASRNAFFGAPWQYAKTQQATASATIKHQLNDNWVINGTASYQNYTRDYKSLERIQWDKAGNWNRPMNQTYNNENYYLAQAFVNGNFKTGIFNHKLLAGFDGDYNNAKARQYAGGTYDKINLFDPKAPRRTDEPTLINNGRTTSPVTRFGAYVQDLISLGEKWNLLAGIRWSMQETSPVDGFLFNRGPGKADSATKTAARTDKAWSPRVGLVFKPIPTTSIFASYSNSFTPNTGTDIYMQAIKPSIVDQFEVGVKNDFFNSKLSVNVTAYRIINNNLAQMAQFKADGKDNGDASIKELTGETTSDGVEVDIAAHPVTGLNIIAGYSYNNMRYSKTSIAQGSYLTGERLVSSPAHTANGTIFYTFSNGRVKGLKLGATAVYIGDRVAGWNTQYVLNTTTKKIEVGADRRIPINGYFTLDLTAGYSWKNISLLAKVSNLTNTLNYIVHENYSVNPIAPRQFMATVAYRF